MEQSIDYTYYIMTYMFIFIIANLQFKYINTMSKNVYTMSKNCTILILLGQLGGL